MGKRLINKYRIFMNYFFDGMAKSVDLFGAMESERVKTIINQSVEDAIRRDWQMIGSDLKSSIDKHAHAPSK